MVKEYNYYNNDRQHIFTHHQKPSTQSGGILCSELPGTPEYEHALQIVNQWRKFHFLPMRACYQVAMNNTKQIDTDTLISDRLKRMESILSKLRRFRNMGLERMQDIGGVRIVCHDLQRLQLVVQALCTEFGISKNNESAFRDYIRRPSPSGYRGIHIIKKFSSNLHQYELPIEVQIRTKLQHLWATSVETVGFFQGKDLKSGENVPGWTDFFILVSNLCAMMEDSPLIPQLANLDAYATMERIIVLDSKYKIFSQLQLYSNKTLGLFLTGPKKPKYILLIIEKDHLKAKAFTDETSAFQAYTDSEKSKNKVNSVLISAKDPQKISSLYPNYYLDISEFRGTIIGMLDTYRKNQ